MLLTQEGEYLTSQQPLTPSVRRTTKGGGGGGDTVLRRKEEKGSPSLKLVKNISLLNSSIGALFVWRKMEVSIDYLNFQFPLVPRDISTWNKKSLNESVIL